MKNPRFRDLFFVVTMAFVCGLKFIAVPGVVFMIILPFTQLENHGDFFRNFLITAALFWLGGAMWLVHVAFRNSGDDDSGTRGLVARPASPAPPVGEEDEISSIAHLIRSMKSLGLRRGWQYWCRVEKCRRHPELVQAWASSCSKTARSLRLQGKIASAESFEELENFLRTQHARLLNPEPVPLPMSFAPPAAATAAP